MKIAILSHPLIYNYGGLLQSYALQNIIEKLGHKCEVIQKIPTNPYPAYLMPLSYAKRLYGKIVKKSNFPVFAERVFAREHPVVGQYTQRFIDNYIHTRAVKKLDEIGEREYDGIVVGSDQVWREIYFRRFWNSPISYAFLSFTKRWNIKRLAYAASFGLDNLDEYNPSELAKCREGIKHFDKVSVREVTGIDLCRNYLDCNAMQALDPTLLLDREDYAKLVRKADVPQSSGNLLCYILDPTAYKTSCVNKIAEARKLTPFSVIADGNNRKLAPEERIHPAVETWLRGFMDAEFVVTDSFHACAFSIIFGVPFLAIGNAFRGLTRFTSLLNQFELSNRLVTEGDLIDVDIADPDWGRVYRHLGELRAKSMGILQGLN